MVVFFDISTILQYSKQIWVRWSCGNLDIFISVSTSLWKENWKKLIKSYCSKCNGKLKLIWCLHSLAVWKPRNYWKQDLVASVAFSKKIYQLRSHVVTLSLSSTKLYRKYMTKDKQNIRGWEKAIKQLRTTVRNDITDCCCVGRCIFRQLPPILQDKEWFLAQTPGTIYNFTFCGSKKLQFFP